MSIRWADDPEKRFLSDQERVELATWMIKSRILNEKLRKEARRRGADRKLVGGVLLSWGAEHLYVGLGKALQPKDHFWPDHRSHIIYLMRGVAEVECFRQMMGKINSPTLGRDGYMDFPRYDLGIEDFISDMAASLPPCVGYAWASEYFRKHLGEAGDPVVHAVVFGDGAISQGVAAEAFNQAAINKLPVLFVCNNNGVALSVLAYEETASPLTERVKGFGINVLPPVSKYNPEAVYYTLDFAARQIRKGLGPYFVEVLSVRTEGHNEDEVFQYMSKRERAEALAEDPVESYVEFYLRRLKKESSPAETIIDENFVGRVKEEYEAHLERAWQEALGSPGPRMCREDLGRVFVAVPKVAEPDRGLFKTTPTKYRDAVNAGYRYALQDPRTVVLGEDVSRKGGVQGVTKGLGRDYGAHRVLDMPLMEQQIVGSVIGAASRGLLPIGEAEYGNFIICGMSQLANKAGTFNYLNRKNLRAILRLPQGGVYSGAHFHSACVETLFVHLPGFKVVCPATAYDAKGLFISAFRDPNFVIYCDWVGAYDWSDEVPENPYQIPIGQADIKREGRDITIVTYGAIMLRAVREAAETLHKEGIEAEIVDLRSFWGEEDMPFDVVTCWTSVKKTGRLLVVHEAQIACGIGAEVISTLVEAGFRGALARLAALHTPVPFSPSLERFRIPSSEEIALAARSLIGENNPEPYMWRKYTDSARQTLQAMRGGLATSGRSEGICPDPAEGRNQS